MATWTGRDIVTKFKEHPLNGQELAYKIEYVCGTKTVTHYVDVNQPNSTDVDGMRIYQDTLSYAELLDAGLTRNVQVKLYTQNANDEWSAAGVQTANNPQPVVTSPTATAMPNGILIRMDNATDTDIAGYKIHMDAAANFTPSSANLVYQGPLNNVIIPVTAGDTRYFKVAAYDAFGEDGLTYVATGAATATGAGAGSQGPAGQNAVSVYLTNESHVAAASSTGVVSDYSGSGGSFRVFDGTVEKTGSGNGVVYSVLSSSGFNSGAGVSIANTGIYTITNATSDTATATFQAVYNSVAHTKVYTFTKSKSGNDGSPGQAGAAGISAFLTNEAHTVPADSAGTVQTSDIQAAAGQFKVYAGTTDVTASCSFSSLNNVGGVININSTTGAYGLNSISADNCTATLRATYLGVNYDRVFSVSRAKGGAAGKSLSLFSDRQTMYVNAAGTYVNSASITFQINRVNVALNTQTWTVKDANGVSRTPLSTYLTVGGTDIATMSSAQFEAARNGTSGVIVQVSTTDGVQFLDQISVSRVQEGAAGAPGAGAKTLTMTSDRQIIAYTAAGVANPTTQTTTFTLDRQNTTNTPVWTVTDIAGVARTPLSTYLTVAGDSLSATMSETQFASARNSTTGVIVQAAISADSLADKISVLRVVDGASGTNGTNGTNGSNGTNGITAFLTNEAHVVAADLNGNVANFNGAGGTFKLYDGATDKTGTASVTYSWLNVTAGLSISVAGTGVYTISGLTVDSATATLRATYNGIDYDRIYSISKSKTGQSGTNGTNAVTLTVISDRQAIYFDSAGSLSPTGQSITFSTSKQNTTGQVDWTMTDMAGTTKTGLSATTGDSVTLSAANFVTAKGSTNGVIVTGTLNGTGISDKISIVAVSQGAQGPAGQQGTPGINAPQVLFQFSANGSTNWQAAYFTGAYYFRTSVDGGVSWSTATLMTARNLAELDSGANTKLNGIEVGADVTSIISGPTAIVIPCDYLGNPLSGVLPKNLAYSRIHGSTNVTNSTTWSAGLVQGGATFSMGATNGFLVLNSLATNCNMQITSTYNGVVRATQLSITKDLAAPPPPPPPSNPQTLVDQSINSVTSTSYDLVNMHGGPLALTPVGGTVNLVAHVEFERVSTTLSGNTYISGQWYKRTNGGAWTAITAEVACSYPAYTSSTGYTSDGVKKFYEPTYPELNGGTYESSPGYLAVDVSGVAVTAGVPHEFALALRKTTGTNVYCYGSCSVTG